MRPFAGTGYVDGAFLSLSPIGHRQVRGTSRHNLAQARYSTPLIPLLLAGASLYSGLYGSPMPRRSSTRFLVSPDETPQSPFLRLRRFFRQRRAAQQARSGRRCTKVCAARWPAREDVLPAGQATEPGQDFTTLRGRSAKRRSCCPQALSKQRQDYEDTHTQNQRCNHA